AIWVSQGSATGLETVFVTFSYYASFTRVMWNFNNIYRNIETNLSEAAQFTELLMDAPKVFDPEAAEPFVLSKPDIEFSNVSFFYEDSEGQHLFKNFDLKINSGEKLALVGRSGGGKSTITKLLLRFMDVQEGEIKIGEKNIKNIRQKDLRNLISYVPQEPIMFHRTIAENIKYGRLDATEEDVKEAARMAHATEFIDELPKGYDTLIGERGVKLSGGQRQRIAIARAIIRNAPILVLDEATSSLDSESEKLIQGALKYLMENRTAIVIAHRLSTIQNMDRIVVLNEGEIIEQGTHRELLEKSGHYAMLWAHQSGGFIEEQEQVFRE
ncbi:MAG: ATP-binding cassette domain-containing protein, partial [Candidatus Spechtbacterales bacterium]